MKFKVVDDNIKTILVDTSLPCSEVVDMIAKKVGIKNPEEFALQAENKPGFFLWFAWSIF